MESSKKIRVLLVDDHKMMRDGLRFILESCPEIEVIGEAGDGRSAIACVRELHPDIVVMDIGMQELNGIEAARRIRAEHSDVNIVALSTHSDRSYVLHMLSAGAAAYVLKDSAFEELHQAVLAVHAGHRFLSPAITGIVVEQAAQPERDGGTSVYATLGSREREVLQLLAEGYTSPQIGLRLHMAVKTVESHRRNIMRKLGIHSIALLTKYAVREGLSNLEDSGNSTERSAP